MGLAAKVAGMVLGPRPGLAIVSFWGGRIEIILRILAPLLGSLPALISAVIALVTLRREDETDEQEEQEDSEGFNDLVDKTYIATGVVIAVAGMAIIIEVLTILLRFLNIGIINWKIKIFLIIDIVVSFVLAGGHVAGGVLQGLYGYKWDSYSIDDKKKIKISMIASAAFCSVAVLLFVVLAIFMIIYKIKGWNRKVAKATIKKAVTG